MIIGVPMKQKNHEYRAGMIQPCERTNSHTATKFLLKPMLVLVSVFQTMITSL